MNKLKASHSPVLIFISSNKAPDTITQTSIHSNTIPQPLPSSNALSPTFSTPMIEPVDFSKRCTRDYQCRHTLITRVVVITLMVLLVSALLIVLLVLSRRRMRRREKVEGKQVKVIGNV